MAEPIRGYSGYGWYCPHCKAEESLYAANCHEGVGNQVYFDLMEGYDPVEFRCHRCSKTP